MDGTGYNISSEGPRRCIQVLQRDGAVISARLQYQSESSAKEFSWRANKNHPLHRSFNYIPADADLAFYFDGNYGNFLGLQGDSIVLTRSEGIVDGQQHAALVLFSDATVDASDLRMRQTKTDMTMRKAFHEALEKAVALRISPKATNAGSWCVGNSQYCCQTGTEFVLVSTTEVTRVETQVFDRTTAWKACQAGD